MKAYNDLDRMLVDRSRLYRDDMGTVGLVGE